MERTRTCASSSGALASSVLYGAGLEGKEAHDEGKAVLHAMLKLRIE